MNAERVPPSTPIRGRKIAHLWCEHLRRAIGSADRLWPPAIEKYPVLTIVGKHRSVAEYNLADRTVVAAIVIRKDRCVGVAIAVWSWTVAEDLHELATALCARHLRPE